MKQYTIRIRMRKDIICNRCLYPIPNRLLFEEILSFIKSRLLIKHLRYCVQ